MVRFGVAAALLLALAWPGTARAHHPATVECQQVVRSCHRDVPRCGHLLDVVQQECRVWRSECSRTGNGRCAELAARCEDIWLELRDVCEPRIDECEERVAACDED